MTYERTFIGLMLGFFFHLNSLAADEISRPASRVWIERPWEIRYFIQIANLSSFEIEKKIGLKEIDALKKKDRPKQSDFWLSYHTIFNPQIIVPLTRYIGTKKAEESLAALVIQFDKDGYVTTSSSSTQPLRGRLTELLNIELSTGDELLSPLYHLGGWWMGFPDGTENISPALCSHDDLPAGYMGNFKDGESTSSKYHRGYDSSMYGGVGCREWAFQLLDPKRPYIDITTYQKYENTIFPIIGWSLYGIKPKPVIGQHHGYWVCLYECPNGEPPGVIENIKLWAARNGWPAPQPPKKQPQFPDALFKEPAGHFPNDSSNAEEDGC